MHGIKGLDGLCLRYSYIPVCKSCVYVKIFLGKNNLKVL